VFDVLGHFPIRGQSFPLTHHLHAGLGVDDEDLLERDSCMEVCHCVVLSVPQACHEGIGGEELTQQAHHVGLDVAGLLEDLL
jgi:hypothetical protein